MKTRIPDNENLLEHELDIYIGYEILDISDLVTILGNFGKLYNKLLSLTSPVYIYDEKACHNFMEVTSINTGESINFKLKEGWRPEFRLKNGDLNVYCPKKLGIPAIIFILIVTGMQNTMGLYNQYQDMEIKRIEHKIKEMELYQKLEEQRRLQGIRGITQQINKTINFVTGNPRLKHVEIKNLSVNSYSFSDKNVL